MSGLSINVVKHWQYAQISTPKKYAQISKQNIIFFKGYLTPLKRFFAPKMLKSAPKWL
jgi:hypothetical protein